MSALVRFTAKARKVTGPTTATQEEYLQLLGFRAMKLQLRLVGIQGATTPVFKLVIEISNVLDDSSFRPLGEFETLNATDAVSIKDFGAPLLWVRWKVTDFSGMDSAWFTLEGVAFD